MTDSTILPGQRAALVDRNGTTTPEFYRFFRGLSVTAELPARVDDLSVRVAALEEGGGIIGNVVGQMSIVSAGILSNGLVTVRLAGDVATAPALSFYGALTAGAKGWQTYSANFSALNNGDGTTSLDLADLANSGTGAALVKITRDAKGRLSGTSAATTSDLAEGANLYFTATRVLATVLAGLSTATNAVITATDTVLSALGKLQAQITANLATLIGHTSNTSNPHSVTKAQVGLSDVDNTSDGNKPVSTPQAAADALRVLKAGDTMTGNLATTGVFGSGGTAFAGDALFTGSQAGLWAQSSTGPGRLVCLSSISNVQFIGARSGGTLAAPTATPTSVALLEFDASSYTGSGWVYPGTAAWVTTEAHSSTARGTRFQVATTPTGTTTLLPRLHIDRSGNGAIGPGADNTQDLGEASLRFAVVRAGTGSINTSDAREKTDVAPLTSAELAAAADLARAPGTYQWLSAVQAKGADARLHAGLTVQRAIEIMQSHGLDPMRYGFICYDQWPETPEVVNSWPAQDAVLDDAGNVVTPAVEAGSEITQAFLAAGDRYSFRHDELLLFIVRGFAARLDALESA